MYDNILNFCKNFKKLAQNNQTTHSKELAEEYMQVRRFTKAEMEDLGLVRGSDYTGNVRWVPGTQNQIGYFNVNITLNDKQLVQSVQQTLTKNLNDNVMQEVKVNVG